MTPTMPELQKREASTIKIQFRYEIGKFHGLEALSLEKAHGSGLSHHSSLEEMEALVFEERNETEGGSS